MQVAFCTSQNWICGQLCACVCVWACAHMCLCRKWTFIPKILICFLSLTSWYSTICFWVTTWVLLPCSVPLPLLPTALSLQYGNIWWAIINFFFSRRELHNVKLNKQLCACTPFIIGAYSWADVLVDRSQNFTYHTLPSHAMKYRVIKKSLCAWWLQYNHQVHRDFLITLYFRYFPFRN